MKKRRISENKRVMRKKGDKKDSTSRFISLILRHKPAAIGITLDEHGWADVQELIDGINQSGGHFRAIPFR